MKRFQVLLALLMVQGLACAATMHTGFRFGSEGEIELIIKYNALLNTSDSTNLDDYCVGLSNHTLYSEGGYRICEIGLDLSGTEMIQGNNIVFENGIQGQEVDINSASRLFVIMEGTLITLSNSSTAELVGNEYSWTSDIPVLFSSLSVTYSINVPQSTYKYISLGIDSKGNALLKAGNRYRPRTPLQENLILNGLEALVESIRGKKSAFESNYGLELENVILNSSKEGGNLNTEILAVFPGFLNDTVVRTGLIRELDLGMANLNYFEFRGREIEESTLGAPDSGINLTYVWNNIQARDLDAGSITLKTAAGFGMNELLMYIVIVIVSISIMAYVLKRSKSEVTGEGVIMGESVVTEAGFAQQKKDRGPMIFVLVLLAFSVFWNILLFMQYQNQRGVNEHLLGELSQISAGIGLQESKLEKKAVIFRIMGFVDENLDRVEIGYAIERSNYIKYVLADHSHLLIDAQIYATIDEEELIWLTSEVVGDATDKELKAKRILRFVQSIQYEADLDSFTKYPLETLVDASGDCEDLSVLAATMLKIAGINSALIVYPLHVQAGIELDGAPSDHADAAYYSKAGRNFYPAETTSVGWEIGDCAEQCEETPAHILIM